MTLKISVMLTGSCPMHDDIDDDCIRMANTVLCTIQEDTDGKR